MAFIATSANHEAPWKSLPGFSIKQVNTGTWGANSNTCVITDSNIHPNSMILVQVNSSSVQALGQWSYTYAQGSVTITSSDSESSTLPLIYIVL